MIEDHALLSAYSNVNFRFRDVSAQSDHPTSKRYVISSPPDKFVLDPSDLIFCLMQFDYCAGGEYNHR